MNREKQLIKNTAIITIGKICTQLITFLLLPLYTAILSTKEYGIVDLLNTLVQLCLPIVTLQIEQAVFRFLIEFREKDKEKKEIITTTMISVFIEICIYVLIFIVVSNFIHNDYKYFLLTNVVACIMSSIMLQISRGLGDNKNYAIGSFLIALFTIIFNIIFIVVFKYGAYGMLAANFIANIIGGVYIFITQKLYKQIDFKFFKYDVFKKLTKYSIPLIPNAISWWVLNASDRIIITYLVNAGANGCLSVANKFSGVYMTVYTLFNMAWTESVALHIKDKDNAQYISKITNIIMKLFSTMALGIIACMPFVFKIMVNENYESAYNQIPILMIAGIFNVLIGLVSVVYIAKKDTKAIAKTSFYTAIINLIIDLLLVKKIGIYAASISTLIAYLTMAVYRYNDVKKYIKIKLEKKYISIILIIGTFIVIAYYINNLYLNLISLIICVITAIVVNKNSIGFILSLLKNRKNKEVI